MEKTYKILFFDLDDTLLDYTGDEKKCIEKVFEIHGMTISDDVFELYYSIDDWQLFTMGNITAKTVITDHFRRMLKMLEVSSDEISDMCDEFYEAMYSSFTLKDGVLELLNYLKDKNYKLYITSNGFSEIQRNRIEKSGIGKYFDNVYISEEIDLRKPGKAFFNYVFNRVPESKLKNVLIIGDAPTSDILGGINSGIDTCWLNNKNGKCKYKFTYEIDNLKELMNIL